MTCIAWVRYPGITSIAADRCATRGDTRYEVQKLYRHENAAIATCGGSDYGQAMLEWYRQGAKIEDFPERYQSKEDYAILVVAKAGVVCSYDRTPYPIFLRGDFGAFGSGREFAFGALAMGASPEKAIEIASKYCEGVGFGVDTFSLTN